VAALVDVCKRTGVVMTCGHNDHAHDAVSLTIKKLIDTGELGTITAIEKTTAHSGGLRIKPGE